MLQSIRLNYLSLLTNLDTFSEDDVKEKVIIPILTQHLGYKEEWIRREKKLIHTRKAVDIMINDSRRSIVAVEVKKNTTLSNRDILQLADYLNTENITWGILTNGIEWLLLNHSIRGNFLDKVILHVDLQTNKKGENNGDYFEMFDYNSLFKTLVTNYYRDAKQFEIYAYKGNTNSWQQYKYTFKKLINFLISTKGVYIDLSQLHLIDFVNYFKWVKTTTSVSNRYKNVDRRNEIMREETIKSTLSYLKAFYRISIENKLILNNPLEFITYRDIVKELEINALPKERKIANFTEELMLQVYNEIDKNKNKLRDRAVFSLLIMGLNRIDIVSLLLEDFNGKQIKIGTLKYKRGEGFERIITLPPGVCKQIVEYLTYRKKRGIKSNFLFCKSDGNKIIDRSLSWGINRAIHRIDSCASVEKIQQQVIKQLLFESRDFISISYLTGIDITSLRDLLSWDEIRDLSKVDGNFLKHHPFKKFI